MAVYLIAAGDYAVKIGKANDIRKRLSELQVGNHERLRLVRAFEGGEAEEAALHLRFAHLHKRGDWFALSREMMGDIGLPEITISEPEPEPLPAEPPAASQFGERLAMARRAAQLSQRDLAIQMDVSPGAVAQWETEGKAPRFSRLVRLASLLNVTPDWLLATAEAA